MVNKMGQHRYDKKYEWQKHCPENNPNLPSLYHNTEGEFTEKELQEFRDEEMEKLRKEEEQK